MIMYEALSDLFRRFALAPAKKNGVAFIGHPRSVFDATRKFPFLRWLPKYAVDSFLRNMWPVTATKVEGLKSFENGEEIPGYIIGVPLTPKQMMEDKYLAKKRILQAVKLAEKKGAILVGLGGLTASLTEGGTYIIKNNRNVDITTGRSYTAHTVTSNFFKLAEYFDISLSKGKFAIVGGGGSIGVACAEILLKNGVNNLTLIDTPKRADTLERIVEQLKKMKSEWVLNMQASHYINDIRDVDIIIAATNAPEAVIKSEHLRPGAIVIDDAQPSDVDATVLKARDDVLIIEGGVITADTITYNINLGLASRNDIFSCLAEVLTLAAHKKRGHFTVGWLDLKLVDEIREMGTKLGFKLAPFQNRYGHITEDYLQKIKDIRAKYKHNHP